MILNLKLEVGITNLPLLQQTIRDLHAQGAAPEVSLNDLSEAAAEVINNDIPLSDAGLELIHWEAEPSNNETSPK